MARAKQTEIEQFKQKRIGQIEDAADAYVEKRDQRTGLGREEKEAKDKLIRLMHEHQNGLDHQDGTLAYTRSDYNIVITQKEDLKVSIGEEPNEEVEVE